MSLVERCDAILELIDEALRPADDEHAPYVDPTPRPVDPEAPRSALAQPPGTAAADGSRPGSRLARPGPRAPGARHAWGADVAA